MQTSAGPGAAAGQVIITVVYAGVIVLGAPLDLVLSRYAADRVYEGRADRIAAPLRRVLALSLVGFAGLGALAMVVCGVEASLALPGVALTAIVGAQWLLLSAAGGLSSPGIILRAFALGAPVSVVAALALSRSSALDASGYLYGFGAGQMVTLGLLLDGTLRALPPDEDEDARVWPAFREYWLLAAATFAFHAGLWVDKIVVYLAVGSGAASRYAAMAAVAWLSVVPACAYLFIAVETVFYRCFRGFYSALRTGASLGELEARAARLRYEVSRTLCGVASVQLGVSLVCAFAAPRILEALNLAGGVATFGWLLAGAALQVLALTAMLLLYYFDFRRDAFVTAVTQLVSSAIITSVSGAPDSGAGYALACGLTCAVGIPLLRRRMTRLLAHTFQSQPYSAGE